LPISQILRRDLTTETLAFPKMHDWKTIQSALGANQIESNEPAFSASRCGKPLGSNHVRPPSRRRFPNNGFACVDFGIADPSNGLILMEEELIKAQK